MQVHARDRRPGSPSCAYGGPRAGAPAPPARPPRTGPLECGLLPARLARDAHRRVTTVMSSRCETSNWRRSTSSIESPMTLPATTIAVARAMDPAERRSRHGSPLRRRAAPCARPGEEGRRPDRGASAGRSAVPPVAWLRREAPRRPSARPRTSLRRRRQWPRASRRRWSRRRIGRGRPEIGSTARTASRCSWPRGRRAPNRRRLRERRSRARTAGSAP